MQASCVVKMIEEDIDVLGVTVVLICLCFTRHLFLRACVSAENKAVLITGCDNEGSFGQLSAEALAKRGFRVFATCYTQKGYRSVEILNKRVAVSSSSESKYFFSTTYNLKICCVHYSSN